MSQILNGLREEKKKYIDRMNEAKQSICELDAAIAAIESIRLSDRPSLIPKNKPRKHNVSVTIADQILGILDEGPMKTSEIASKIFETGRETTKPTIANTLSRLRSKQQKIILDDGFWMLADSYSDDEDQPEIEKKDDVIANGHVSIVDNAMN